MLFRYSFSYLFARGAPGLVNLAALAIYTRLLSPGEFGQYAIVLVGVGLVSTFSFQWQCLVVARFLSAQENSNVFLSGIMAQFLALAALFLGGGLVVVLLWPDLVLQRLVALAVILAILQAAFELTQGVQIARHLPSRCAQLHYTKAFTALIIGGTLAWLGIGAAAPLLGLIAGNLLALLVFGYWSWYGVRPIWPERSILREQLAYGLPLTATFAMGWVVSCSDRLMLGWLVDADAAGHYSAGFDLIHQGLTLVLSIIHTAAYPLAVNALERQGSLQAREQLRSNGELLIAAALAGGCLLVVLAPAIVYLLIGTEFRAGVLAIIPLIAAASALAGIKTYHYDIAFHLSKQTRTLVSIGSITAFTNLVLNFFLIPSYGPLGAAWATLVAWALSIVLSATMGTQVMRVPAMWKLWLKGTGVALIVSVSAGLVSHGLEPGLLQLGAVGVCGLVAFFIAALLFDIAGLRCSVVILVKKRSTIKKYLGI